MIRKTRPKPTVAAHPSKPSNPAGLLSEGRLLAERLKLGEIYDCVAHGSLRYLALMPHSVAVVDVSQSVPELVTKAASYCTAKRLKIDGDRLFLCNPTRQFSPIEAYLLTNPKDPRYQCMESWSVLEERFPDLYKAWEEERPKASEPEKEKDRWGFGKALDFSWKPVHFEPPRDDLDLKAIAKLKRPVLVPVEGGYQAVKAKKVTDFKLEDKSLPPMVRSQLEQLTTSKRPTVFLAKSRSTHRENENSTPYAVILPKRFNPSRAKPYSVMTAVPPTGTTALEAARAIARAKDFERPDTVVIVPEMPKGDSAEALEQGRAKVEHHVLDWLQADYNIDFSRYSVQKLKGPATDWGEQIAGGPATEVALQGPMVHANGAWRRLPPTKNWERPFQPKTPSKGDETPAIPSELQRQSESRGSFFAVIQKTSRSFISSVGRFGVYLPPGYDPADKQTRYPVLVLLPGAGNPLHYWPAVGRSTEHFDHLMRGDGQKMIVVINDGTGDGVEPAELVEYATTQLQGDAERISLGGISKGAGDAQDFVRKLGPELKSLSLHSPSLMFAGSELPSDLKAKIYLDAGKNERTSFIESTVDKTLKLRELGADVQVRIHESNEQQLEHRWAAWEQYFENWVAFHQSAHGAAGPARLSSDIRDVSEETLKNPPKRTAYSWDLRPSAWHKDRDDDDYDWAAVWGD